jgi:hypothetical protein
VLWLFGKRNQTATSRLYGGESAQHPIQVALFARRHRLREKDLKKPKKFYPLFIRDTWEEEYGVA